jgi:hypothetical protein
MRNPLVAKKYNTRLTALIMGFPGIPFGMNKRVDKTLLTPASRMMEIDFPISDLISGPLALTMLDCQE